MNDNFMMTKSEYELILKIARKSKMDCWFRLETSKDGSDYVRDAESGKVISLCEGLKTLVDGLTEVDLKNLTHEEMLTFLQLLGALR